LADQFTRARIYYCTYDWSK